MALWPNSLGKGDDSFSNKWAKGIRFRMNTGDFHSTASAKSGGETWYRNVWFFRVFSYASGSVPQSPSMPSCVNVKYNVFGSSKCRRNDQIRSKARSSPWVPSSYMRTRLGRLSPNKG